MRKEQKLNFNAGPAVLPPEVLQQASEAVLDYDHSGLSLLEIPHRGSQLTAIIEEANALVKELCGLGDNYEVIWLQGGGRLQFSMVPMNFLAADETAGYVDSGYWADEAIEYARCYGNVSVVASSKNIRYRRLPPLPALQAGLKYLHITTNNTIYGTQWKDLPAVSIPLIADMSSDILSMQRDYTLCDMFYAVAQKNLGAAGNTLVVIKKDLLPLICRKLPPILDYAAHVKAKSMLNTSPVFSIYVSLLMLRWIRAKGMAQIEAENRSKADMLYAEIERNPLFECIADSRDRSLMNVVFRGKDDTIERSFLRFSEQHNILNIAGHRVAGAFRASLYNGMPEQGVRELISVIQEFSAAYD